MTGVEVFDLDEDFFRRCRDKARDEARREPREPREDRARGPKSPAEREQDAQALAQRMLRGESKPEDPEQAKRRQEEAQLRAAAHERIEAAEAQARGRTMAT